MFKDLEKLARKLEDSQDRCIKFHKAENQEEREEILKEERAGKEEALKIIGDLFGDLFKGLGGEHNDSAINEPGTTRRRSMEKGTDNETGR